MKITLISLMVLSVTFLGSASAQTSINYGSTNLFHVQFNKHGACVAVREINVRTNESTRRRTGAFAFGISEIDGQEFTLVSFMNPKWQMEKGQSAKGYLTIDGVRDEAIFWADGKNMLSAAIKIGKLEAIAFGSKLTIDTGLEIYSLPLTGTAKALPLVIRCYKENISNKSNPLGSETPSERFKTRSSNPLGQKY